MEKLNIITVEWEDITFFKGVYEEDEIPKLVLQKIETTGYLVERNKECLVIALSRELTEPYRIIDLIKIPRRNIIKEK